MNNQTYDILKRIALIVIPALATFVNAVGIVWGVPYTHDHRVRCFPRGSSWGQFREPHPRDSRQSRCDEA